MPNSQQEKSKELGEVVTVRLPKGDRRRHRVEAAKRDESRSDRLRHLIALGEKAERQQRAQAA